MASLEPWFIDLQHGRVRIVQRDLQSATSPHRKERAESADSIGTASTSTSSISRGPSKQTQTASDVLWCESSIFAKPPECAAAASFCSPAAFSRWLFTSAATRRNEARAESGAQAPRGARLLVGWREAKPCASALKAAMTGNTRGLRIDDTRPKSWDCEKAKELVRAMVIICEPHLKERAQDWIRSEFSLRKVLHLRVATASELPSLLREQ
ncbi:unnamed protein product [Effrenium voratum]|uniref:Uncharacterized protein n=1 Tax=Effrenium voratum TaxID=2562239 RepID=A0AA36MP60_9DINO|nr:unnamed protein product [Effrenium voratum]